MIPSGISNTYTLYKRDRAGNCLKLFPIQYTLTCQKYEFDWPVKNTMHHTNVLVMGAFPSSL